MFAYSWELAKYVKICRENLPKDSSYYFSLLLATQSQKLFQTFATTHEQQEDGTTMFFYGFKCDFPH